MCVCVCARVQVVRHYHGHLSGVYCMSLHPTIDVLLTGGRDSTARVWDMRTKACIHTLAGHTNTVADILTQAANPQVLIHTLNVYHTLVVLYI